MEGTDSDIGHLLPGPHCVFPHLRNGDYKNKIKPSYITVKPPWRLYDKMFHKLQSPELRDLGVHIVLDTALFRRVYPLWILDPL